jgi:hypothetical protein
MIPRAFLRIQFNSLHPESSCGREIDGSELNPILRRDIKHIKIDIALMNPVFWIGAIEFGEI